ncbi:fatty acid desaturase family protein [Pseudooceanicola batsensis HTCC2597]|uniref:Fatty acid desaturase family protein n=1 Tax=Pseudooceanicola batsensis (strain ATCC BAA-863 / DSM 15984 / KCTC 12145 / HTCC2597) TaxID=252305 RepID=A3U246_PSEBH|nr:alkane 1-monooxygenase [Pseudooceanicola batsensis]EAQ01646.1 fatty acid desaturase family protein [Pseudooceanicola batsensis HTCC2597]
MNADHLTDLRSALPFWVTLTNVPLAVAGTLWGGLWLLLLPGYVLVMVSLLDRIVGLDQENADPDTDEARLFWHRAITLIWVPVQFVLLFWIIGHVSANRHLTLLELFVLLYGVGLMTGAAGIVYAHELMHQRNRFERWLGDILLSMVLYSHFRSEHLLVHHHHVATPKDAVTARYNESFYRFFVRVLRECPRSAWKAEIAMLARRGAGPLDRRNPFWRYLGLQLFMIAVALVVGGWYGLALFLVQAFFAVWLLELTNYVEHYGLTRKHLGSGKFEHVKPQHSWNAAHRVSNWFLINLQRHSDHHYKPDRRFPLLQSYGEDEAPQLPYSYPLMTFFAMIPPVWRRMMNPRVRKWRGMYYPEITDWEPYKRGTHPG